jgi:hypothetical protein
MEGGVGVEQNTLHSGRERQDRTKSKEAFVVVGVGVEQNTLHSERERQDSP